MKKIIIILFFAVNCAWGQSSLIESKSISVPQHTNFSSISALSPSNGTLAFDNSLPDQALYMYRQFGWVRLLHMPIIATTNVAQPLIDIANSNTGSLNVHGIRVSTASLSGGIGLAASASASNPTNHTYGVLGSNSSTNSLGYGVYGIHSSSGVGVRGISSSGNGVEGEANSSSSIGVKGVYGIVKNTGTPSNYNYGVYGENLAPTGYSIGIYGKSNNGDGIWGVSTNSRGVHGESVSFTGVYGESDTGYGIHGQSSTGIGGYFSSSNSYALITGTGNVGIGNSTPNAPLQFSNALNNRKLVIYEAANNAHQFYGIGLNSGVFRYQIDGTSSNHIFYAAASASSSNELMRITGLGRVGIGVASPDQILDVNGRARIRHSGNTAGVWMSSSTNSTNGADGAFYGMKTDTEAGIWIGNNWRFWVNNSGNATFTGTVTASCGVLACSDFRFKTNIKPIENSLESILKINGVRYNWKKEEFPEKNFNDKNQLGFIAQEIEKIFPEMVFTDEKGYKSVDYSRLTPVLVEAIKELKMMNDELKNKNQKIESRLERIEAALNH